VDIGANPSAEGGGDDEGTDDQAVKVVDIVDTFRLQVSCLSWSIMYIQYAPFDCAKHALPFAGATTL
jgi:hypothetical protein